MSKAALISIRPKWCELIASGKKTVEIRKTKPNAILPLKVYIYQTKEGKENPVVTNDGGETFHILMLNKVIGEFVCHNIFPVWPGFIGGDCLTFAEQEDYLGPNGHGWGWAISDVVIYDKPKQLSEFKRWNRTEDNSPCAHVKSLYEPCESCKECNLTRPPQSWCYVEELQ